MSTVRHYVLFDTDTDKHARFDELDLGTDMEKALKDADYRAGHLTNRELEERVEFRLVACDVPADTDLEEIIWSDYAEETIRDYKQNLR